MKQICMSIQKIWTIGLVGIEFRSRYPRNAKLETEFCGYLGQVCLWEDKRKVSGDQLIFWPFNLRFDRSTLVLIFECALTEKFCLNISTLTFQLVLWQFWLTLSHFSMHFTDLTFTVLAGVFTIQLAFWLFNSRFDCSTRVLTFKCAWTENFYSNFSTLTFQLVLWQFWLTPF